MKRYKKNLLAAAAFLFCSLPLSAQSADHNYVKQETMLNASKSQKITSVQYYDGYSRPVLLAGNGMAGGGKYTFALTTYDGLGRVSESWLPAVGTTSSSFLAASEVQSLSDTTYGDSYAYTRKHYDALGRTTSVDGIGSAWRSAGKKVTTAYGTNTSSEVRKYTAVAGSGTLSYSTHYSNGTLSVETTTDEDGKTHVVYKDATGKTVLERSAGNHDTYYVYDNMDRLRFVLPPCASDALASTGSWSMDSNDVLRDYAYYYEYDGRGRCIKKKLPGAEHILYEYDTRDRMTFSQDGVQRTTGKWTFYVYDNLNRLVQQGENTSKSVSTSGVYLQNYYDNYSYVGSTHFPSAGYNPEGAAAYSKGMLTGTVVSVFGSSEKIATMYHYDNLGRVAKTIENNLMDGYNTTVNTYTFTGKPATVTVTHTANGKLTQTEVYTYTYDSCDRISSVSHKLNNGSTVTLASYTYDNVGRMATKKLHGSSTNQLTYTYNVRSWLTGINSGKFTQNLYYNTGSGTPYYNGNISSMTWKSGNETTIRGYKYSYDAMNRLTAGNYGEGSTLTSNTGRYSEIVGQYDKNGNISAGFVRNGLLSTGGYGTMNALVMTLDGNHLKAVRNATGGTAAPGSFGFVDGVTQTTEYTYDNNGNLTQDLNKGITNISYNVLSLPQVVTFSNGNTITYLYTADGRKLRTVHVTNGTATTTDYCGNVIYENGTQKLLLTEEGYIDLSSPTTYYYYLKDHQGNNRVVVSSSGTVMETNHYYPFGGVFSTSTNLQPYKYNGKELDTKNGLNWYDYGARHYDAALGRWFVVDPLTEKDYFNSPYNYCGNNPIIRVDKDGKIWETVWDIGNVLYDVGAAVVSHISGDHEKAQGHWVDAGVDAVAMAVPGLPAGLTKLKYTDEVVDAAKTITKVDNAKDIAKAGKFNSKADTYSTTAKESFRKAKEQNGIPKSQQPDKVIKPNTPEGKEMKLDNDNVKLYEFTNSKGEKVLIRQDKPALYKDGGMQPAHFNAGFKKDIKLKQHHYYGN